ncbi:uncharacterized protein EV420DRAFT_359812 [Desarmillaria tabescens]|uniref:Uncharacterized protein n=1 Tax=Armillaria tabescens TaxID=1929756 RepID=A0AA39KCK2_ARMTA|nr:uncharacterized protein EV420DRAFT_359812 [Desarmillaria tabescens]KAK0458502.1 hypothetical protein EV420DRAFT_359812 [Desarmillaria tabescens]
MPKMWERQSKLFLMSTASLSTTITISSGYTNGDSMAKIFTLVKKTAKKPIPFVKKKGVETLTMPLECLKAASVLIPVPALGPATDIVFSILKKVDQSQQNTGTAREIVNLCLKAHVTLSEHLQSVEITPALLDSIRQFEAIYIMSKTLSKSMNRRCRLNERSILNHTTMSCNASKNGSTVLCRFSKSRSYFRLKKPAQRFTHPCSATNRILPRFMHTCRALNRILQRFIHTCSASNRMP